MERIRAANSCLYRAGKVERRIRPKNDSKAIGLYTARITREAYVRRAYESVSLHFVASDPPYRVSPIVPALLAVGLYVTSAGHHHVYNYIYGHVHVKRAFAIQRITDICEVKYLFVIRS